MCPIYFSEEQNDKKCTVLINKVWILLITKENAKTSKFYIHFIIIQNNITDGKLVYLGKLTTSNQMILGKMDLKYFVKPAESESHKNLSISEMQ